MFSSKESIKRYYSTHIEKKKQEEEEEAKEITYMQNIFISVLDIELSFMKTEATQPTWGPERPTIFELVACIPFNAERPVHVFVVHFSI